MGRLVLPAGAKPDDLSWIRRDGKPIAWADVARESGVEIADEKWLADNAIVPSDGYGIRSETPPAPVLEATGDGRSLKDVAAQLDALTAKLRAKAVFTKQDTDDIAIVKAVEVEAEVI